jgi:hypothetical protein
MCYRDHGLPLCRAAFGSSRDFLLIFIVVSSYSLLPTACCSPAEAFFQLQGMLTGSSIASRIPIRNLHEIAAASALVDRAWD